MKVYDYLLFRIYSFYTDKIKEKEIPLFYTSAVSSILVGFNLLALHSVLKYFELMPPITNKYFVLIMAFLLLVINYYFLVKNERFLERKFTKDVKGGWLVVGYIILTTIFSIVTSNYNRTKIFKERNLYSVRFDTNNVINFSN